MAYLYIWRDCILNRLSYQCLLIPLSFYRPGSVQLVNESEAELLADYQAIRNLEDYGLFTVNSDA